MKPQWRLLVTEACDGATNMAIDEALWRGRQAGVSPPTIRFYAWDPPTVSLGYGQAPGDDISVAACRRFGVAIVRRPTGGSAIYHDGPERELTYSVIASAEDLSTSGAPGAPDTPILARAKPALEAAPSDVALRTPRDMLHSYRWICQALLRGLRHLGASAEMVSIVSGDGPAPAFCFARTGRYEIEIGGKKVVGSAQRRRRGFFLQHGSVVLGVDEPRVRALFPTTTDPLRTMTTLEAALGRRPAWNECREALTAAFEVEHAISLLPGGLSVDELAETDRLVRERYATDAWLAGAA